MENARAVSVKSRSNPVFAVKYILLAACLLFAVSLEACQDADPEAFWSVSDLLAPPRYRQNPYTDSDFPGLQALLVEGRGPNGTNAEFFVYYAKPDGPVPEGGFPGVLLVHGGGGTAYPNYVQDFVKDGFAVLALDWYNQRPAPALTNVPPSQTTVPRVPLPGGKRQDHVANVANMVLAHSLLRSFPEVNAARTVYVGLSWGSWYGSCVTAIDNRFKGACMIYLCDRHPNAKADPALPIFVKGPFHKSMKVPSWWISWSRDPNGVPETLQAAWEACPCENGRTIVHNLGHSHDGFSVVAVHRMARYFVGMDVRLPRLTLGRIDGRSVFAEIVDAGKGVKDALLWFTRCPPPELGHYRENEKTKWLSAPAKIEGGVVSAILPDDARIAYLSVYEAEQSDSRRRVYSGSSGFFFQCKTNEHSIGCQKTSVEVLSPEEGETVCLLNDGNRAFLSMDAEARRRIFKDKAWRKEAVKKWRSVPRPVTFRWKGADGDKVRLVVTGKGELKPCFDEFVEGCSAEVWNLEVARDYGWVIRDGNTCVRGTFRTEDFAPRVVKVKGVPNFRDFGGWKTVDGGRVRQGLVYRSQGLNQNADYYLTAKETMDLYKAGKLEALYGKDGKAIKERIDREGGKIDFDPNAPWMRKSLPRKDPRPPKARLDEPTKAYLLDKLGIRSDVDLRGPTEVWGMTESPLGSRARWFWLENRSYDGVFHATGKDGFSKVFKVFLDEANYPIVIHCIGGADRTGCAAWILNGLLGVAEDDLMKDWELTCFAYESQSFGHETRIDRFLEGLNKYSGGTMQERCESYVKSLGFTDADLEKFRSIMLER